MVDRVRLIQQMNVERFEFHVFFGATEELYTILFSLRSFLEVNTGAVPDVENSAVCGSILVQCLYGLAFKSSYLMFLIAIVNKASR